MCHLPPSLQAVGGKPTLKLARTPFGACLAPAAADADADAPDADADADPDAAAAAAAEEEEEEDESDEMIMVTDIQRDRKTLELERRKIDAAEQLTARMTGLMANIASQVMSVEHPFVYSDAHIVVKPPTPPGGGAAAASDA